MYLQIIDVICLQLIPINDKSLLKNPRYKLIDILIHEYSNINKSHAHMRADSWTSQFTVNSADNRHSFHQNEEEKEEEKRIDWKLL